MKIKIFGERNTATNALAALIRKNSESFIFPGSLQEMAPNLARKISMMRQVGISPLICEDIIDQFFQKQPLLFQWKHTATNFDVKLVPTDVLFLFTVRHPLSWLYSLYKNPYHILSIQSKSFEKFIFQDWKTLKRDNVNLNTCTPSNLYRLKLLSYIDFISHLKESKIPHLILKFEDIVSSQEFVFQKMRSYLDNSKKEFEYHFESTKDKNKNLNYYKNYYKNELWRQEIDLKIIKNFQFDRDLLNYFDY